MYDAETNARIGQMVEGPYLCDGMIYNPQYGGLCANGPRNCYGDSLADLIVTMTAAYEQMDQKHERLTP